MVLGHGTSAEAVEAVQRQLQCVFPTIYHDFLIETNGGEGPVGEFRYARFLPVGDLLAENDACSDHDLFDQFVGLTIFGSDGGGEAFCFDQAGEVVQVAFISAREDNLPRGSFMDFMGWLSGGG
jgi:SMI1 / KNR4 family (SUKH-1)